MIDFERHPDSYRHWRLSVDGPIATLEMKVDPEGGLASGYTLKLNSYDLGVDIELADAVQRLRFEHPEVHTVVLTSALDKVFCAGANISMLAQSTHHHKVNFCKFTNETRNGIEDASRHSRQTYLCALNGTASGGGYELALACEEIVLVDDRSSAVSLPEVALLGVLPGTGGLTRLTDKRKVRHDRADAFSTKAEGMRGEQAVDWGLVDAVMAKTKFDEFVRDRSEALAAQSDRPDTGPGIVLSPLRRTISDDAIEYGHIRAELDRTVRAARITIEAPDSPIPAIDRRHPHRRRSALAARRCARARRPVAPHPLQRARARDDRALDPRLGRPRRRGRRCARAARGPLVRARGSPLPRSCAAAPRSDLADIVTVVDEGAASRGRSPSWCSRPTSRSCSMSTTARPSR